MPDPREEEETPSESCRQGSSLDTDRCTRHRAALSIPTTSSMMGSGLAASSWSFTLSSTRWGNRTSISAGHSSRTPRYRETHQSSGLGSQKAFIKAHLNIFALRAWYIQVSTRGHTHPSTTQTLSETPKNYLEMMQTQQPLKAIKSNGSKKSAGFESSFRKTCRDQLLRRCSNWNLTHCDSFTRPPPETSWRNQAPAQTLHKSLQILGDNGKACLANSPPSFNSDICARRGKSRSGEQICPRHI